jgi:hypothetical protein
MSSTSRIFENEVVHSSEDLGFYFGEWNNKMNTPNGYGVRVWNEGKKITEGYRENGLLQGVVRQISCDGDITCIDYGTY